MWCYDEGMKIDLKALSFAEIKETIQKFGEKAYRANQITFWVYQQGVGTFDQMTDLSKAFRQKLKENFFISKLSLAQVLSDQDGTRKFVFGLSDGLPIETVLIPDNDRLTLCISSQVGCRQGCRFCLTGRMGLVRNLFAHEIIDQVIQVKKRLPEDTPVNIVIMGMGEPLDNYQNVVKAIRLLIDSFGLNIPARRITLSTAGLVPQIAQLSDEKLGIHLAVSLNAPNDKIRNTLMPINQKFNMASLLDALRNYSLPRRSKITFEYILIPSVNDSFYDAKELAVKLKGIPCKINLIPYNPNPCFPFKECTEAAIEQFQKVLYQHHLTAIIRKSKGREVSAACGQLGYQAYLQRKRTIG